MIALIVARSRNNVIGRNGQIPWKIKGEQAQFKKLTTGNVVVMGRKSYEEIGHPLPNRMNIIVSRSANYSGENLVTVSSLQEAIEVAGDADIYVCGGYGLFMEAIPMVEKMYITEIDIEIKDGDVFFPKFNKDDFDIVVSKTEGEDIKFTRTIYTRKK
ncbi:dihydrofolate reductase [Hungatella hathewayi]